MLPRSFYVRNATELAPSLLGCTLVHRSTQGTTAGIIVETEAYTQDDPASHSFGGRSRRNAVMYGPAGHAYVYFSYGVHHCLNVVGGEEGRAEAVLVRALEPTEGLELMQRRRGKLDTHDLCSGPGKLVQAMGLGPEDNGADLTSDRLHLLPRQQELAIAVTPRIGITKASEQPWRFIAVGNPFVTKHKFNKQGVTLQP
jgi:DNA-3-methyladenine glycosylase